MEKRLRTTRPTGRIIRVCLVLFAVTQLFLFVGAAAAQSRTVVVSPVAGNPLASGTALRNALAAISSPSAADRWLLKLDAGIYDIGTTTLLMRSFVDLEGSGIEATTIRGSVENGSFGGTLWGANDSELRLLTVQAVGNAANTNALAMGNFGASPRLYRARFISQGGTTAWGLRNFDAAPTIEECEISASAISSPLTTQAFGIVSLGFPPSNPFRRASIIRSKLVAGGGKINYGILMEDTLSVTLIRESSIEVFGGNNTYGVLTRPGSPNGWTGQAGLFLQNTEISSYGGTVASYGILFDSLSTPFLTAVNSRILGHSAPQTYGLVQRNSLQSSIQGSLVIGYTKVVDTMGSIVITTTGLAGGPVTATFAFCAGVWDENPIAYPTSCPP